MFYEVVTWPDVQELMTIDGFRENSYLVNDEKGIEDFGSSAYFVNVDWLADEMLRKHPKYTFCGHIHSGEHTLQTFDDMKMANVSLVDETYTETFKPLYLDVE